PERRTLVDLETHPVAEPVAEALAVARVFDHAPGGAVGVLALDAAPDRVDAGLLGAPHEVVQLSELRCRLPERDGPSHVGVVPLVQRAEIELHELASLELAFRRRVVRLRRALAERDDRLE